MIIKFADKELELIFTTWKSKKFNNDLVYTYVKKVILIQEAQNENDLRNLKSLHFEKLKWNNSEYSIRLNDKYRLIFEINKHWEIKIILITKISKHYE